MKTNAPKEIYILPDDRNPNGLSICWYEAPYRTGAIEYTRTDAFIEKIEEYIYKQLNEGCIECGDIGMFIENMKKYMKG
jgi:hypothetical protein